LKLIHAHIPIDSKIKKMKIQNKKYQVSRVLFSTFFLVTSSCSTMINPHVEIGARPDSYPVPLNKAINYANKGKDKYAEALGEQAEFNSYLGIGLTALGAAALGLGVTGGGATAITVLGLTGASAYGVGSFLENKPRQRAYILGYNAINCAVDAVLPLNVRPSTGYDNFSNALYNLPAGEGLLSHIENTEKAISNVKQIKPVTVAISRSISAAESLVETAKIAYANGVSLDLKINNSGNALTTSVDRIVGQVNDSINTNQADLQSIMTIIGGLGGMYSQFTTVPQSMSPASDVASLSGSGPQSKDISLHELLNSVAKLSRTTQVVTAFVNAIVAEKPIEQLKLCGVDPEDIASSIEIDPAGVIEFIQGKGGSEGRIIRGGNSPYSVTIASSVANGISVKQSIPFAPLFVVEASKDAVPGDYALYVTDGSGHSKFVTVKVITVNSKPGSSASKKCNTPPSAWVRLAATEKNTVQKALCTQVDGKWGCNTLEKFNKFKNSQADSQTDSTAIEKLLHFTTTVIKERCQVGTDKPAPNVDNLSTLVNNFNGIAFELKGLEISILKATVNETKNIINLKLGLNKMPSIEISKEELINTIITEAEVQLDVENIEIQDFEQLKSRLKPVN
jgi:hypothetical protein